MLTAIYSTTMTEKIIIFELFSYFVTEIAFFFFRNMAFRISLILVIWFYLFFGKGGVSVWRSRLNPQRTENVSPVIWHTYQFFIDGHQLSTTSSRAAFYALMAFNLAEVDGCERCVQGRHLTLPAMQRGWQHFLRISLSPSDFLPQAEAVRAHTATAAWKNFQHDENQICRNLWKYEQFPSFYSESCLLWKTATIVYFSCFSYQIWWAWLLSRSLSHTHTTD